MLLGTINRLIEIERGCRIRWMWKNWANENVKAAVRSADYDRWKQSENVQYCNCRCSRITNDARCTREITFTIATANNIQQEEETFTRNLHLNLRKKLAKCYIWSIALCGAVMDTLESRSELSGKFWNVVLDKQGEDHLDRSCEKWKSNVKQCKAM